MREDAWLIVDQRLHIFTLRKSRYGEYRSNCGTHTYGGDPENANPWDRVLGKNDEVIDYHGAICGNCFKSGGIKVSAWRGKSK